MTPTDNGLAGWQMTPQSPFMVVAPIIEERVHGLARLLRILGYEGDPLLANRMPLSTGRPSDAFTRPQPSGLCRRFAALPQFVHVRGGADFFMPGISTLRYLAGS